MKLDLTSIALVGALAIGAGDVSAQPRRAQRQGQDAPAVTEEPGVSPAEIQRMFDAYALMQAQEQLKIGEDQFNQFLTRFKNLQDVRRKGMQERARLVVNLRRLLNQGQPDDAQLRDRLKELDDVEARVTADTKKAYEAIDQVLNVSQQARFRVFEENMERRKQELVNRARQANKPKCH